MLHAVIMAGGSGTRFWPVSRRRRPKQLLPIAGDVPLLRRTFERLQPWIPSSRVWVVTTRELVRPTADLLPELPRSNILGEPAGRDTAACAGYAAIRVRAADPEAVCLVLPADHVIGAGEDFREAMEAGADHVREHGGLLTFGIRPTRPETGYGYLELGPEVATSRGHAVHRLRRFVEKPDAETARTYLARGGFLWNSGMFVWQARDLLEEIAALLPELSEGLEGIAAALGTPDEGEVLDRLYPQLPRTSVDFGVMERARLVWCIPVAFPWSDVGSWHAAWEVAEKDAAGTAVRGRVVTLDARSSLVVSDGPAVAVAGVEDLVVVATADAVLVVPRSQSQRVKEIVAELERRGWSELL
jgi:mannose-1-phosphate guanylyltransferase